MTILRGRVRKDPWVASLRAGSGVGWSVIHRVLCGLLPGLTEPVLQKLKEVTVPTGC